MTTHPIREGDTVTVTTGEHQGVTGVVMNIFPTSRGQRGVVRYGINVGQGTHNMVWASNEEVAYG